MFLGRWTAFLRAVMPGLAGLSRMPYRRFLLWNALGGLVWGVTFCLVGYLAGNSYEVVAGRIGTGGAVVTGVLVLGVLVAWAPATASARAGRTRGRGGAGSRRAGDVGARPPGVDPGRPRPGDGWHVASVTLRRLRARARHGSAAPR